MDEGDINSEHDSEDSNAESFYANSYPEDEDASSEASGRRMGYGFGLNSDDQSKHGSSDSDSDASRKDEYGSDGGGED